jgi:AraC family transcriptional regulator, positive regulator of tynA and feaB
MKKLFSTDSVHRRDRFDYWHSAAREHIVDHDSEPVDRQAFQAELEAESLAGIGLIQLRNSPMRVMHTTRHIRRQDAEELFVCRQIAGALWLEQEGREVTLQPGDLALVDPQMPYSGRFLSGSRLLVLKVPRMMMEARIGRVANATTRRLNPEGSGCGFVSEVVAMLPGHAAGLGSSAGEMVREQVLDLIGLSIAEVTGSDAKLSSAQSVALTRLKAAVEARLADPDLGPDVIAAAAGVSVRYANAVLARDGTSIMRLVQARRLERCRKALADPAQAHRTISDIAYGWGFTDLTHFGRAFRAAYGMVPRDYRARAMAHAAEPPRTKN